ncbi:uncharacterized protein BCR38DRAFT_406923 [Pseudomassariella vexata]|uniref:Integral membrane protein TmpA n=1 Tax=Pseudomassariella vexata TaxID=1141098 RepID=A0A1Y2EBV6_9PEZI|nr:uncharacterized protein BCR38DRAFT_406923 [Pseudomassariella vexata]ORY69050.1 hypothetical protein BCR38DRAFT_406923 [Pseudomassariella vexata]
MAAMADPLGPDVIAASSPSIPVIEAELDSDISASEGCRTPPLCKPLRAFFPIGKTGDGRELYSLRTLEAVGYPSNNSSTSSLTGPNIVYQLKPQSGSSRPSTKDESSSLPQKKGSQFYRWLRWGFGSVYRRIFTLAYLANLVALAILVAHTGLGLGSPLTYSTCATAVSANILASLLVRNEHVVNAMFIVFGSWPRQAPLSLRRVFAKVYSYGGIHSGCGVSATFWYIAYLVMLTQAFTGQNIPLLRAYTLLVSYLIVFLLVTILVFAHPRVRVLIHNWFEGIHRYLGWSVVVLFWAQTMMLAAETATIRHIPMAVSLVISPSFWMLIITTLLVIYPWTHLRLRDVEAEPLSDHVIKLNFSHADAQYGQAVRLSDAPLKETHAFAVIPNPKSQPTSDTLPNSDLSTSSTLEKPPFLKSGKGFSVLISNAGDWTNKIIHNPPKKMWIRGLPQYGVLRVAGLFDPVIIVATGSGIGPCLSFFVQKPDHPVRIIWSTPNPVETYGQAVVDLIFKTDPRAIIHDTRKLGRPDLVAMTHLVWEASRWEGARGYALGEEMSSRRNPPGQCEAVVIISNQKVTKKVVYGLESRGIPAYGAIFDS